jgi:hypothetical protein
MNKFEFTALIQPYKSIKMEIFLAMIQAKGLFDLFCWCFLRQTGGYEKI